MKENRAWFLPALCARGVIYGFKVKVQNIWEKCNSILSYPERNGVEAAIELSSGLLGTKILIPAGMAKASTILEKINRILCSLLLLGLAWIHCWALLGFRPQQKDHQIGCLHRKWQPLMVITAVPSFPCETEGHSWETRAWLVQLVGQVWTGSVHFLLRNHCQSLRPNCNQSLNEKLSVLHCGLISLPFFWACYLCPQQGTKPNWEFWNIIL